MVPANEILTIKTETIKGEEDANKRPLFGERACTEKIRSLPDVPSPGMQFSKTELNAYFAPEERVQRTGELICQGDKSNSLELTLRPEYHLLIRLREQRRRGR